MSESPNWEYEAPKFVDFCAHEHLNNIDENYFDHHRDSNITPDFERSDCGDITESEVEENFVPTKPMSVEPHTKSVGPSRVPSTKPIDHEKKSAEIMEEVSESKLLAEVEQFPVARVIKEEIVPTEILDAAKPIPSDVEKLPKKVIPSNIMTPGRLGSWKSRSANFNVENANKNMQSTPKPSLRRSARQLNKTTQPDLAPPKKKQKTMPKNQIPKVTMPRPRSIDFKDSSKPQRPRQRCLTSEERDLEKMKQLRDEAKRFKDRAKKELQKLERQSPVINTHAKITRPKEFHFKTDERIAKAHSMQTRADGNTSNDFVHDLRKYAPSPVNPRRSRTTVTQPFHLSYEQKKRRLDEESPAQFVPMAKAIIDFHSRTPRRYRTNKNKTQVTIEKNKPLRVTHPKTPQLSKPRARPASTLSAQERENMEIEEMKSFKFKANPVNHVVLSGTEKLRKVEKKPPTVPVEFHLSADRHKEHETVELESERPKPFKAQPIPSALFDKTTGVKKRISAELTVPQSPAFALKNRIKPQPSKKADEAPQRTPTFCHPPPTNKEPFVPKLKPKKTEPQPFSFDAADQERFAKKDEKIIELIQKEEVPHTFKAHPMPIPVSPTETLPAKQVKEVTKPKPFKMNCDERAVVRGEEWIKQAQEQDKVMREMQNFKANKGYEKITRGKAWNPKASQRPPTEPMNLLLHSDKRAKEREEYLCKVKEEAMEKEAIREEQRKLQEKQEKEELKELRKGLTFKATDIKHFKAVQIAPSDKQLTLPESPNFSKRFNK
ncbi:targeting protein for Xklp2-like [Clavelina lepadiformis]|uniref:targeting protein for Xklp2-like n=1 Tax=Clavelina lepadiformis TaxID=159417 RepID=UPI0040433714